MKTFNFYSKSILLLLGIMMIFSCSENPVESNTNELQNVFNSPPLPLDPNIKIEILGHYNEKGIIDGYYYYNDSSTIYPLGKITSNAPNKSSEEIVSLVGDQDNFGYGGTAGPACRFFDLSTQQDNVGNFDRIIMGPVDAEKSWTHDFTDDPLFCSAFIAEEVTINIREYFNDAPQRVTVEIDGQEMNFAPNGLSACQYPKIQTFKFTGDAASFANDGVINISVHENGDEVALDYSLVTIKGHCNTIIIQGCDTGVANKTLGNGDSMQNAILALAAGAASHGDFVKAVSALTNDWKKSGLIASEDKDKIMACAGDSSIGK